MITNCLHFTNVNFQNHTDQKFLLLKGKNQVVDPAAINDLVMQKVHELKQSPASEG